MQTIVGYKSETQTKNLAWFLPRPKPDKYKGGMPLYAEKWLLALARDLLNKPDAKILNVFCGMNQQGFRVDLNPKVNPDLLCDIHKLTKFHSEKYDIVFADPPYSDEETKQLYGDLPKLNYAKWSAECDKLLNDGGLFIVYHKLVVPNPDPEKYMVLKRVFIGNRVWHLPRVCIFFQKKFNSQQTKAKP
jgi:hypothetical protein